MPAGHSAYVHPSLLSTRCSLLGIALSNLLSLWLNLSCNPTSSKFQFACKFRRLSIILFTGNWLRCKFGPQLHTEAADTTSVRVQKWNQPLEEHIRHYNMIWPWTSLVTIFMSLCFDDRISVTLKIKLFSWSTSHIYDIVVQGKMDLITEH